MGAYKTGVCKFCSPKCTVCGKYAKKYHDRCAKHQGYQWRNVKKEIQKEDNETL